MRLRPRRFQGAAVYANSLMLTLPDMSATQEGRNPMFFTVLMFVVLIACFALTFGLVKFSENIIARSKLADDSAVAVSDAKNLP